MNRPDYEGATSVGEEPKRRKVLPIILALIVLAIIAAVVLALVLGGKSSDDAKKSVSVKTCTADAGGGKPTASGVILNHSSKSSNYLIKLKFNDAQGNSVSEGAAPVKDVEADQAATWELTGTRAAKGPLTCEISGVSRTHVPGQ